MPKYSYKLPALILSLCMLSACEQAAFLGSTRFMYDIVQGQDVNVTQRNYAAADYLQQQIKNYASKEDLIRITPLYSSDTDPQKNETPEFATIVPYQVGERLAQLGYHVDTSKVRPPALSSDPSTTGNIGQPAYVISGSFERQPFEFHIYKDVDVHLEVTEVESGRVIASFNYVMPRNLNVALLSHGKKIPQEEETGAEKESFSEMGDKEALLNP